MECIASTCNVCKALDLEGIERGKIVSHHAAFAELKACVAATSCELCTSIKWAFDNAGVEAGLRAFFGFDPCGKDYTFACQGIFPRGPRSQVEIWHGFSSVSFCIRFRNTENDIRFQAPLTINGPFARPLKAFGFGQFFVPRGMF
jgi:hypothetical protein